MEVKVVSVKPIEDVGLVGGGCDKTFSIAT